MDILSQKCWLDNAILHQSHCEMKGDPKRRNDEWWNGGTAEQWNGGITEWREMIPNPKRRNRRMAENPPKSPKTE